MEKSNLISYAMDFASYLVSKTADINRVILYGSVAREDSDEESDVDIFIDVNKVIEAKIQKKTEKILDDYYKTKKYKEWSLKGISSTISVIVGELNSEDWKGLKRSIINTGIVLYGKYKSEVEKTHQYTIFSFENIKPDKKRIAVFRKLFGFKIRNKEYPGMADKIGAIRLGKGALLVPAEQVNKLKRYFQEKKVTVRLYDLWSDSKLK
ncbi:MAG: nucleotidyltransferase domain-containing protein [Nanoarchaeota archaeon]|nr:nucleotidyltransferase domain-containing protein [Nanoarchaeota archaeon]